MEWGSGKEFGTFSPWFKSRLLKFTFFNVESRGYLWMSLAPYRIFQIDTHRKDLLSLLESLNIFQEDPSKAITQKWFTIDLKSINTKQMKGQLLVMMNWILKTIQMT